MKEAKMRNVYLTTHQVTRVNPSMQSVAYKSSDRLSITPFYHKGTP